MRPELDRSIPTKAEINIPALQAGPNGTPGRAGTTVGHGIEWYNHCGGETPSRSPSPTVNS